MNENFDAFDEYAMQYDMNEPMIGYKYNHTYRVVHQAEEIASRIPDEKERKDSISRRAGKTNAFFSSNFFQAFPIVIIASKSYISRYKGVFSLEDLFGLPADSKKSYDGFYTYSRQGDSPKLLICCRHFASRLSDSYINEIASAITEFQNKIQI